MNPKSNKMKSLISYILVCAGFLLLATPCVSQPLQPSQHAVTIPTGGNTFITSRDDTSTERIRNGIERWTNPSTIYSTFFRISTSGKISLFMKCNVSANSEIKATCGNSAFHVKLSEGVDQVIFIGTVAKADTGYVRVDLQGIRREGDEFAQVAALLVDGDVSSFVGSDFSFYFGRRGPSVHLSYPFPEKP